MILKSLTTIKTDWFYVQTRQTEWACFQNRYRKSSTIVKTNGFVVQKRQTELAAAQPGPVRQAIKPSQASS